VGAEAYAECRPIYEEMPGWQGSTLGIKSFDDLPDTARAYLKRIEEITDTPIHVVSTGPDRTETIILKHPFD
jgi:adenylosuccinate synthase